MDIALNLTVETVERAMSDTFTCVDPSTPIEAVVRSMTELRVGSALVCQENALKGIFTERDVLRLLVEGADLRLPVSDVMTPRPETLRSHNTMGTAIQCMADGGFRRLPIVNEQGHPVGVLKASNIVHYLVEHFPASVYNLPPSHETVMQDREGA